MLRFHVKLSAVAVVEGALDVVADSPEDAENEAYKRIGDVQWAYRDLNGEPIDWTRVLSHLLQASRGRSPSIPSTLAQMPPFD